MLKSIALSVVAVTLICLSSRGEEQGAPTRVINQASPDPGSSLRKLPRDTKRITWVQFSGGWRDYTIPWSHLPQKTTWDPELQPFPIKLHVEAERARRFLYEMKGVTNEMSLSSLHIYRLFANEPELRSRGILPTDYTNQWYVNYTFSSRTLPLKSKSREVVALMDGAYADEKELPPSAFDIPRSQSATNLTNFSSRESRTTTERSSDRPGKELDSTDFGPVPLQWNPQLAPFPLDLSAETRNAKAALITKQGMESDFILLEISARKYAPRAALEAQGLDLRLHNHHWLVVFTFYHPKKPSLGCFNAPMLLDRRILGLVGPNSPYR